MERRKTRNLLPGLRKKRICRIHGFDKKLRLSHGTGTALFLHFVSPTFFQNFIIIVVNECISFKNVNDIISFEFANI